MNVSDSAAASRLQRYGIAVLCVALAVAVRLALDPVVGSQQVLFTFILATLAATRIGGRGPGLVASALSVLLAWYFLIEPRYSFVIANARDVGKLVVLAVSCAGVSLLIGPAPHSPAPETVRLPDSPFLRRAVLYTVTLVMLAVFTQLLYADFEREKSRQQWVAHSYQVLNAIQALLSTLQDAETGERGYLLTGDDRYLEPFESALREERSTRQTLQQLTADNPAQQASLDKVDRLVEGKLSVLQKTITLRRNDGIDASLAVVRTGEGKRIMDESRVVLTEMKERDRRLLADRIRAADDQAMRTRWILGLGSSSLLILLVIAVAVIERDSRKNELAKLAVSRSEHRLHLALDSAKAGAWEWNLKTGENTWSEELWELYGLEPHSCRPSYQAWKQVVHPADRAHAEEVVGEAARTGSDLNVEFRVRDRDGAERWLLARGQPMRNGGGCERFVGIILDITARKRAEQALRESEAQFRTLANAIPQLCWMANADGGIVWYNQRWYDYTGATPEQMEGWGWKSVHDPAALPEVLDRWNVSITTGEPFDMVFPLRGADGAFHPFLTRVMPVRDREGKVVRWFGTHTDIGEQQMAEDALRQALQQRQLALEAAGLGAWDYCFQSGDVFWDDACRDMFGVPKGSRIAYDGAISRIHPEDAAATREAVSRAIAGADGGAYHREFRVVWPDNSVHWIASHGRVQFDEKGGGQAVRFTGVNMDITERKRAEREIRLLNSQLEERVRRRTAQLEAANQELEAFSYSVSHDLRAPLRHIGGFVELLEEHIGSGLDEKGRRYLDTVLDSASEMGNLIDDLLRFSRTGRVEMCQARICTADLVKQVQHGLAAGVKDRKVVWTLRPLPDVTGDPTLLKQVFVNLLDNAIKYTSTREEAAIEIGCREDGADWIFFVQDNGVGFDMRYAGKLFGVFQRLHSSGEFDGTGIGLANVRRIVGRHGGRTWAESVVGRGASFFFSLPKNTHEAESQTTSEPPETIVDQEVQLS